MDGGWSFPGGWTEIGLSPMESAKKKCGKKPDLTAISLE